MKKLLAIFVLAVLTLSVSAQFKGFFDDITPQFVAENAKAPLTGTYMIRWDVGLVCPAFGLKQDETGKITGIEGRDFSKLFGGFLFTHVKPDGKRDWGAGIGFTIPDVDGGRFGAAVLGGYSIFRVGINYDFGLSPVQGLSILGGITVDLFNLTE